MLIVRIPAWRINFLSQAKYMGLVYIREEIEFLTAQPIHDYGLDWMMTPTTNFYPDQALF